MSIELLPTVAFIVGLGGLAGFGLLSIFKDNKFFWIPATACLFFGAILLMFNIEIYKDEREQKQLELEKDFERFKALTCDEKLIELKAQFPEQIPKHESYYNLECRK